MKKTHILILSLALLLVACSAPATVDRAKTDTIEITVDTPAVETDTTKAEIVNTPAAVTEVDTEEISTLEIEPQTDMPANGLSIAEIEGLMFMREEEKLARDVYLRLYDQWNMSILQNIAESESTHMEAILTLLNNYDLKDPAAGNGIGEFTNSDLQALYTQLVAQGEQSLSDALKVGAAIEEIDILDLEEHIAQTDKEDIVLSLDKV